MDKETRDILLFIFMLIATLISLEAFNSKALKKLKEKSYATNNRKNPNAL